MVLLPALALVLLWVLFLLRGDVLGFPRLTARAAFVLAFGAQQVLVVLMTEGWSVPTQFTRLTVASTWAVVDAFLAVSLWRDVVALVPDLPARMRHTGQRVRGAGADVAVALIIGAGFLVVLAALGWLYRPNNGDSMVYHLARVEHWVQNRSVHPYATHYLAQVELGPLSSYNFAHLHVLTGDDRLDGYVQLLATAVCVLGVAELARRLGLGPRGQAFAGLLCLTIPNLVLEATSTQNNNFAAAVGVTTVVILTSPLPGAWLRRGLAAGCAGGLILLAKGTIVALLGPVLLTVVLVAVGRRCSAESARRVIPRLVGAGAAAAVAAVVLAGPFVYRNFQMFDAPSGPVTASTISTDLTARAAVANVLRSTAGEFAVGDGLFPKPVAGAIQSGLSAAFDRTGVEAEDWRYLVGDHAEAFEHPYGPRSDRSDSAGANPYHVLLVVAALSALGILVVRDRRRYGLPFALAVSLTLGFLAFTTTARWSIFAVRYYTPLLVLWCPLLAWTLRRVPRMPLRALALLLTAACLPQLLGNVSRPLIPLNAQPNSTLAPYFLVRNLSDSEAVRRAGIESYDRALDTVVRSGCTRVGIANWILREYPLWAGLRLRHWPGLMNDVDVSNESHRYSSAAFAPCALLRQVSGPAVTEDRGWAAFRFDSLAVSLAPTDLGTVDPPPGFVSAASGVAIYPGSGWQLPPDSSSRQAGTCGPRAELLLRTTTPGTYVVRIEHRAIGGGAISSPSAIRVRRSGTALELTVRLKAGVTALEMVLAGGTRIEVTRLEVSRG